LSSYEFIFAPVYQKRTIPSTPSSYFDIDMKNLASKCNYELGSLSTESAGSRDYHEDLRAAILQVSCQCIRYVSFSVLYLWIQTSLFDLC